MGILGINPLQLVRPMAEALAIVHWTADRDAYDVEFVLGSSPGDRIAAAQPKAIDLRGRMVTTWNRTPDGATNLELSPAHKSACGVLESQPVPTTPGTGSPAELKPPPKHSGKSEPFAFLGRIKTCVLD